MAFVLFSAITDSTNPLSYSMAVPTTGNTAFVYDTVSQSLYVRQEDNSYNVLSGAAILDAHQ